MNLHRLIYTSRSELTVCLADLQSLVERLDERDTENELGGWLVLGGRRFLQVLEGTAEDLSIFLTRVTAHGATSPLRLVEFSPIETRVATPGSLRLINLDSLSPGLVRRVLLQHVQQPDFYPETWEASQCLGVVRDLATEVSRNRLAAYDRISDALVAF